MVLVGVEIVVMLLDVDKGTEEHHGLLFAAYHQKFWFGPRRAPGSNHYSKTVHHQGRTVQ